MRHGRARTRLSFTKTLHGLLAFVWIALAAPIHAALVFQVDQDNPDGLSPSGISTTAGNLGQSFIPQEAFLGGIELELWCCDPGPSSTVRIDVREGGIAGPIIGSSEMTVPDGTETISGNGIVEGTTWHFFPALSVTPGTVYVFEIVIVSGTQVSLTNRGDVYPFGTQFFNGSPTPNADLVFRTGRFIAEPKLYWADPALMMVERSGLDGSNIETVTTALNPVNGVAVDPINAVVYWLECCGINNGRIRRADLDGGNVVTINTSASFGFPERIVVDPDNQYLFFSDPSSGGNDIQRINSDGSGLQVLLGPDNTRAPVGLALDPIAQKLYWTEGPGGQVGIHRMNLDGSAAEPVLTAAGGAEISNPQGLAIDADDFRMYWTDLGIDEVRRANLDGSNVEVVADNVSHSLQNPMGIAVDPVAANLYWSDTTRDTITRADLTGQNAVDIVLSGLAFTRALDLVPVAVPEPSLRLGMIACIGLLTLLSRTGRKGQRRVARVSNGRPR